MRTYRIQFDERTYTVSVEETGPDTFRATLNDEVFEGEVVAQDRISTWVVRGGSSLIRAHSRTLQSGRVNVWLAGMPFPASVDVVGIGGYTLGAGVARERHLGGEIRALMPGRITSILVKEGERVDVGTPLLILEAMKMQNEIVSPIPGQVKSIQVQEGAAVKKDSSLIIIE